MLAFFRKKGKEEDNMPMFNKKRVEATPVIAGPQSANDIRQRVDDLTDTSQYQQPMPQVPERQSYVDRRINEATALLNEKRNELTSLQQDIQQCVNDATILQEIKDGNALMYITDILQMLDDFRGQDFNTVEDLLDALERDVIKSVVQKMASQKRKR